MTARWLWLPDVLRAAGLTVHEVAGWKTRGSTGWNPSGLVLHATAGSRTSTDAGEIRTLINGSTSAPPPIAPLYLSRSGAWHVVASGRCNHVRIGWGGRHKGLGNDRLVGVEAQNDNRGEPWARAQYDSYVRGVAAICRRMGWSADAVVAHKEHQPGDKSDPTFNPTDFRRVLAIEIGSTKGGGFLSELSAKEQRQAYDWLSRIHFETAGRGPDGKRGVNDLVGDGVRSTVEQLTPLIPTAEQNADAVFARLGNDRVTPGVRAEAFRDLVGDVAAEAIARAVLGVGS